MITVRRAAFVVVCLSLPALPLHAADFEVTRYDDPTPDDCLDEDCSLREAAIAANADTGADRILLSAGTYLLAIPGISENLSATGDLDLTQDVEIVAPGATMSILDGGALDRVLEVSGALTEVTIRGLTIRNSGASQIGVLLLSGSLTIEDSEIRANGTHGIQSASGSLTLRRSTIAENGGTGLLAFGSVGLELVNVTISENAGEELTVQASAAFDCSHCTIQDTDDGDTEVTAASSVALRFTNSIVAGNCLSTDGAIDSQGGNLEGPGDTCSFDQGSDQFSIADLQLGALADEGGPTRTQMPGSGSAAVSGALDAACASDDQRGADRPDVDCDAGADEREAARPGTPLFHDGFVQGDTEAWDFTFP